MTIEIENEIKEFLVKWKNADEKDIDLWLFYLEALEILEQIVKDNN